MSFMQKFRQIGLATLVLLAGSVAAQAANVTLLTFADVTSTNDVTGTALNATQTEIRATGIQIHFGGGVSGIPNQTGYMSFDIISTLGATVTLDNGDGTYMFSQHFFQGSFSITQNANLTGTNYLSGTIAKGTAVGTTGDQSFGINSNTNVANAPWTGTLKNNFTGPFGWSFNLGNINGSGVDLTSYNTPTDPSTIASFTANVQGNFTATKYTSPVPEPSTLSLLGLGAAGLAFGAYRRRNAAAAV